MVCFPNFGMFVIVTGTWECLAERHDEQFKGAHYSVDLRGVPPWKLLYFPSFWFQLLFLPFPASLIITFCAQVFDLNKPGRRESSRTALVFPRNAFVSQLEGLGWVQVTSCFIDEITKLNYIRRIASR
jgi:hypothetical protein